MHIADSFLNAIITPLKMAISQKRSRRKSTGGKDRKSHAKKKFNELGSDPTLTRLAAIRRKAERISGGHIKHRLLSTDSANIYDPKSGKHKMAKIKSVIENPANSNYIRRNFLTKGAIIVTDIGKARITSRPGQEGTVNAILLVE